LSASSPSFSITELVKKGGTEEGGRLEKERRREDGLGKERGTREEGGERGRREKGEGRREKGGGRRDRSRKRDLGQRGTGPGRREEGLGKERGDRLKKTYSYHPNISSKWKY
jgi:hypothetical protein